PTASLRHGTCDLRFYASRHVPLTLARRRAMLSVEDRTEGLNRLIRGELSAIETYRHALDKMKDAPEATELHAMMIDHRTATQVWREHVKERGGNPPESSGPWGAWAK